MAKTYLKGMNDIPGRMTRGKCSRAQNATALARLEQQKSLLKKQLQVWVKQKTITEERLRIVDAKIHAAQQALELSHRTPASVSRKLKTSSNSEAAPKRSRAVEFAF